MELNIEKLNTIFNGDNMEMKEVLNILLEKAIKDGEYSLNILFYGFGFYDLNNDDIDDNEEILNIRLLLSLNKDLRTLILKYIKKTFIDCDSRSDFFVEFLRESNLFIPYKQWKKEERKQKLKIIETN